VVRCVTKKNELSRPNVSDDFCSVEEREKVEAALAIRSAKYNIGAQSSVGVIAGSVEKLAKSHVGRTAKQHDESARNDDDDRQSNCYLVQFTSHEFSDDLNSSRVWFSGQLENGVVESRVDSALLRGG
jgi:hypothetical protein